jgi:hypothetical protein
MLNMQAAGEEHTGFTCAMITWFTCTLLMMMALYPT